MSTSRPLRSGDLGAAHSSHSPPGPRLTFIEYPNMSLPMTKVAFLLYLFSEAEILQNTSPHSLENLCTMGGLRPTGTQTNTREVRRIVKSSEQLQRKQHHSNTSKT